MSSPAADSASAPAVEYRRRLDARHAAQATLGRRDAHLSHWRLAVFAAAAAAAVLAWNGLMPVWALLGPIAAFLVLIVRHDRVIRAQAATARAVELYERGLARLDDRWAGSGEDGSRFSDHDHPYAADLDLFGHGSLFQLLCTARTAAGEETLARWLLHAAPPGDIRARHAAVAELTPALDFREALAVAGSRVRSGVDAAALVAWAESPRELRQTWVRVLTTLAPIATLGSILLSIAVGDLRVFAVAAVLQAVIAIPQLKVTQKILGAAAAAARDLEVFSELLDRLQRERLTSERLVALRGQLDTGGLTATQSVRRVLWFVELNEWQQNPLFGPVLAVFLWGTHLAWLIEAWRRQHGPHVRTWLAAAGEVEALASLATYRYEHPEDPFPELVESAASAGPLRETRPTGEIRGTHPAEVTGAVFDGVGLGHPLLPAATAVRNDVRLTGDVRLLVVSGSNMSGKSTLLRTVGINAVLALAGAPVRAASLRLSPLALGATLRIQDSLQEGRSRFYAEITRIRELADLAARPAAAAVPARRALPRHQLARPAGRRRGRPAQPARPRRDRPGHDARPRAGGDRRRARAARGERPLRGLVRGRRDALRLPHEAGPGHAQQRARADARGGPAGPGNLRAPDHKHSPLFERWTLWSSCSLWP